MTLQSIVVDTTTGVDAAAIINRIIGRENVFLDLNYSGSKASTTNDSAALTTQWNAAIAAGATTIFFRSGTVNLSGLTAPLDAPVGRKVKVVFLGTHFVLADFGGSGTWAYPETPRYLFAMWKRSAPSREPIVEFDFMPGTTTIGGGFMRMPDAYTGSDLSQWGAEFGIHMTGKLIGRECRRSIVDARQTAALTAETNAREVHVNVVTEVVGNGVITDVVLTSVTGIAAGDRLIFRASDNPARGTFRSFDSVVRSILGSTVTLAAPIPTGTRLYGPISTTTSATAAAGINSFTLASVAGLIVGRKISITLDNAAFLDTMIVKITGSVIITQVEVPAGRSVANGAVVLSFNSVSGASGSTSRGNGAPVERLFGPAWYIDITGKCDFDWEFALIGDSTNHCAFFGTTNAFTAWRIVDLGNVRQRGGQHYGSAFGAAHDFCEFYQESWRCLSWYSEDHVHSDNTAGAALSLLGFQQVKFGTREVSGNVALNDVDLVVTAEAPAGQQYIEVAALTGLTPKIVTTNGSGVANTVSITATEVTTATSTLTGGDVSSGTDLPLASVASFLAGDAISYTEAGVLRYNWVVSKDADSLTLGAAIAGTIVDGSTVTRLRSNNPDAGAIFENVNSNRLRMTIYGPLPQGETTYHNILAVDTARLRIYFDAKLEGVVRAGTVVTKIDKNAMADNGDEIFYLKCFNVDRGTLQARGQHGYVGIDAHKGGEFMRGPIFSNSNSGGQSLYRGGTVIAGQLYGPIDRRKRNLVVAVQESFVTLRDLITNYNGQVIKLHETGSRDITVTGFRCNNELVESNPPFSLNGGWGGNWRFEDNRIHFHAYTRATRDPFTVVHLGPANLDGGADLENLTFNGCVSDTRDIMNEANLTGNYAHIVFYSQHFVTANTGIRHVLIDGDQGRSAYLSALKVSGGRIGEIVLGQDYDIGGFTRAKQDLIMMGTPGATTLTTRLASTTIQSQVAGDTSIAIVIGHSFGWPKGANVIVTLDSGTLNTYVAERTVGDGVVKLVDPIPTGRSVANGAAVTFRGMGEISFASRKPAERLGYAASKKVLLASGVGSVVYDIAGLFPCFRHSPGGPRPENCWIKFLTGDRDRVEVFADAPVVVANNTSQAGGSITWTFKDPATPASGKNLTQATLVEVGYYEPAIRFNQ